MAKFSGWAFKENEEELQDRYFSRYKELKNNGVYIYMETVMPGYSSKSYEGKVIEDGGMELSSKDIALLCDSGNLCFGGRGSYDKDTKEFNITVHTD